MANDKLTDEPARQAALERYDVLDSPAEPAFDKITQLVRAVLDVPMSVVSLIDRDRQWVKAPVVGDLHETPRDIAFCDHTIRQTEPMVIPDARLDKRFSGNPMVTGVPNIRSYAGMPLTTPDGYNVGSLCAIDTVPREFSAHQIAVLESLASLVVEQLELRRIAERDHLSGALTRRAFIADMDKCIALFVRRQRPASLVLLDIDHFKLVNDTHGHPVGDKVIRAVAMLCADLKRPSDSLGRLGGEEFGILLPETSEAEAAKAAQRFCDALAANPVCDDPLLRVTASFGVAAIRAGRTYSEGWMAAADDALYQAKRAGRNRVAIARHLRAA